MTLHDTPERPRWIVATPKSLSLTIAKLHVAQAFGRWPQDEDVEICTPPFEIKATYVIDRVRAEELPTDDLILEYAMKSLSSPLSPVPPKEEKR